MRLTLLAASLLAAYAPDANGEPDSTVGETKCVCDQKWSGHPGCTSGKTDAWFQICNWEQECYVASNISFSFCKKKGDKVCLRHQYLGTSGNIVNAMAHHPSLTCCDDSACKSRQTCVEKVGGTGASFEYDYDANGGMLPVSVESAARNGWKDKKGTAFKNKPKVCVDKVFDTTQGVKQGLAPTVSMLIIVLAIPLAIRKMQVGFLDVVTPLIVIAVSFFLTLTEGWIFALFTMVVAVATMATSEENKGKLVIFQVAYVWMYFGGMNFFFANPVTNTPKNYFTEASTKSLLTLETDCSTYFGNYFTIISAMRPWNSDETVTTEGLCGRDWISFLIIMAYFQAFAIFLMVTFTVISYLNPNKPGFPCARAGAVKPTDGGKAPP